MQTPPRRRTARHRAAAVGALVLAAPLLASCGFDVGTDQVYQAAPGANERSRSVDVLGAVVVSASPGSGRVIATLVDNSNEPDQLTGVAGRGLEVPAVEPIDVPRNNVGFTNLADDQFAPIIATGDDIDAGRYVEVRFSFADAPSVDVNVPVVDPSGPYSGLAPGQTTTLSEGSASNSIADRGSRGAFTGQGAGQ